MLVFSWTEITLGAEKIEIYNRSHQIKYLVLNCIISQYFLLFIVHSEPNYLFLRKKSINLQHQTFAREDKGRTWRSFVCSSTWTDGLYGWNWEFHWCQCQFSQVYRHDVFFRFVALMDYHLFADTFYLDSVFWKKLLSKLHNPP